jgi:hypothetical protein
VRIGSHGRCWEIACRVDGDNMLGTTTNNAISVMPMMAATFQVA